MLSKKEENRIFKEAVIGYGFEEIKQTGDGVWCDGCQKVHKRPTKVYQHSDKKTQLCKYYVVAWYNPED
jgi:hypothetical protein